MAQDSQPSAPGREGTSHLAGPGAIGCEPAPETAAAQQPERPPAVPLLEPRDGLPPLVTSAGALGEVVRALGAGEGPVAVDAERASGFRYGHRAFLVQ